GKPAWNRGHRTGRDEIYRRVLRRTGEAEIRYRAGGKGDGFQHARDELVGDRAFPSIWIVHLQELRLHFTGISVWPFHRVLLFQHTADKYPQRVQVISKICSGKHCLELVWPCTIALSGVAVRIVWRTT